MEKKFEPAYRLNLQFFAEGEGGTDEGGTDEGAAGTEETPAPLTLETVQAMIKAENDKVRTEYSRKLKAEQDKVKSLETANMTEQEKFEAAQKELEEKSKTLLERENIIFAKDALAAAELDPSFLDFVRAENEEGTTAKVQALKTTYDKAVAAGIEAHIKGTGRSYTKGSGGTNETSVGAQFAQSLNDHKKPVNGPNPWA